MYTWEAPGFDSLEFKKDIDFPRIDQFFMSDLPPQIFRMDAEEAYKRGGEIVRNFIDSCPLKNDKKKVIFRMEYKYIAPGFLPITVTDWHIDGCADPTIWDGGDRTHLLIGPTTNLYTEFLEEPVTFTTDVDIMRMEFYERMKYVQARADEWGFKPKPISTNEWVTMTCRHFHKIQIPNEPHYRVFVELVESDMGETWPWDGKGTKPYSVVYTGNHTLKWLKSIERTGPGQVYIHKYWETEKPVLTEGEGK